MKKTYYSAQESAYKQIREKGEAGWQKKDFEEFRDTTTDRIIKDFVLAHFTDTKGKSALDLGTGTGCTAHTLHDLGFIVTGVDVCPSAIEHAKEIASNQRKNIKFQVEDVLSLNGNYDLIYDSHCAHCIVTGDDRAKFFKSIRISLKKGGVFILDSMAFKQEDDSWRSMETLRFGEDFILWHKTSEDSHTGVVKKDEDYWCPQRRIYPVEKLLEELVQNGFRILSYSVDEQGNGEPKMLRAACTHSN